MIQHEITLVAFHRQPDGALLVMDIIETSIRYASKFARSMIRNTDVTHIQASRPGHLYALTGRIYAIQR